MREETVTESDGGIRLDRWFKRHYPQAPHALLAKFARRKLIRLNGTRAELSDRIEAGQVINVPDEIAGAIMQRAAKPVSPPVDDRMRKELERLVLYKDAAMLVIDKPAGLAVQGGSGQKQHLDGMLDALRFGATERPKLVHRLDKDTSGVLVLARNAKAADRLAKLFAGKELEKTYLALVRGVPKPGSGTISLPLIKRESGRHSRMEAIELVEVDEEEGKSALSRYRVLDHLPGQVALVELQPVTGRTHQLRVHMAAIGHPILGDGKYGGTEAFVTGIELAEQLHLHAWRITLPDAQGKSLTVKAPLPKHMKESLKRLGLEA